jgi:hypothetical protein
MTDWEIFTAAIVTDTAARDLFIGSVKKYASNGLSSQPFGDWYETTNGRPEGFRARPVAGGHLGELSSLFALLYSLRTNLMGISYSLRKVLSLHIFKREITRHRPAAGVVKKSVHGPPTDFSSLYFMSVVCTLCIKSTLVLLSFSKCTWLLGGCVQFLIVSEFISSKHLATALVLVPIASW